MPFYEYECEACGKKFTLLQSVTCKAEDTVCPCCNEKKAKKKMARFSSPGGDSSSCDTKFSWGGG